MQVNRVIPTPLSQAKRANWMKAGTVAPCSCHTGPKCRYGSSRHARVLSGGLVAFVRQGLSAASFEQGFLNSDSLGELVKSKTSSGVLQSTAFVAATETKRSECTCATVCE